MPGHNPSLVSTSLWQTPQACTLIRTCPASGVGISRSTISKSAPGLETCAAFICAIFIGTTLLVAINPPMNFGHEVGKRLSLQKAAVTRGLNLTEHFTPTTINMPVEPPLLYEVP